MISIHAPRVGSDDIAEQCYNIAKLNFNPRSPCGERPSDTTVSGRQSSRFQSTLPVWGATASPDRPAGAPRHFNPRSPCGERRSRLFYFQKNIDISIHAPRVGSDRYQELRLLELAGFQSTLPVWGATRRILRISADGAGYFNPRSPCGERRNPRPSSWRHYRFQSTLPVWGATASESPKPATKDLFQSTLPVWGATF